MGSTGSSGTALSGAQVGLASARPSASSVAAGYLYYATDTNTLSESSGSAWTSIVAGGGGGFVPNSATLPANGIAETSPRSAGISATHLNPGLNTQWFTAIGIASGQTIGHITYVSADGAASVPTHWWFALFDNNFHQLATTADQTSTAWAANTAMSLAIANIASGASSTFTTTYSGLYYVSFYFNGTTAPFLQAAPGNAGFNATTISPFIGGTVTPAGQTPPGFPTTLSPSAVQSGLIYAYVSA